MTIIWPASPLSNAPISIDGLILGADIDGVKWKYTRLDGWLIGGRRETNLIPRSSQDDMYDGPSYDRERVITIEGIIQAKTRAAAVLAARQLAAVAPGNTLATFSVNDPDLGLEQARVRLSAKQGDGFAQGVGQVRYQLQFTAPDHRKYGEPVTVSTSLAAPASGLAFPLGLPFDFGDASESGRIVFTNSGTAPTEPAFTVVGPMTAGFEVTHIETGRRLRYSAPVGSDVVIDSAAGTVTSGGQDRTTFLTLREWFSVGPGETATFQFSTLGTETAADPPRLHLSASPAYH